MEIIRATELGNDVRMEISELFVDGFYQWLKYFSKDRAKLSKAFRHMFNLEVFYVAVIDDEIVGITACTDGKISSVHLESKEFKKHLGFIRGTIANFFLKKEFEEKQYPFQITKGMGAIEFVATSTKYRGQGVATTIIKNIIDATPYDTYVLEVADTNTKAVQVYEKLGFTEFSRVKQKHSRQSGINALVYMKYGKADS